MTDPPGGVDFDFLDDFGIGLPDFSLDDGATLTIPYVPAGTYCITETLPLGWELAGLDCESDDPDDTSSWSGSTLTIDLDAGETITCTFNNAALGTIVLQKQSYPEGGSGFDFLNDFGIGIPGFSLDDGMTLTIPYVPAGTYSVTEADTTPLGFELIGLTCEDPDGGSSIDLGARTATIDLDAGETITCTFSNAQRGSIIVEKQTAPDGAAGSFTFSGDVAGTISDGGTIVVSDLAPGTYTSTEADPGPDLELAAITCDDGNSSGDVGTRTATFVLDPGETVKCTFSNAQRFLQVDKELLWPVGALAGLGQQVRFQITVQNNGGVTVDPLTLRDEYDVWCLTSRKAQVPPDVHGGMAGFLQWNDLGALAPGETTSLWVEFVASGACDPATNTAVVQADGLAFQDQVTLRILESIARISGRLFHDEAGAGVYLGSTRGVENGQVSTNGLLYTTNTSGWYSFNLLNPGTYHVTAAPPAGSWWTPTTAEACDVTIVNTWDQVSCYFGYWWGLDGPPPDGLAAGRKVTLTPVQDTTISGPEPGNHGARENLWVRQPGLSSALLQFDLSGLPAGAEVVWAKLRLYAVTASNPNNRLYMTAYPVSKVWAEGQATWLEAAVGLPWDGAGATGAGDHADPLGWAWTNTLGWVEFDLDPAVVGGWLADAGRNHGFLVRGEGSESRKVAYWFLSREHGNAAAHPQLVVGYNVP